MHLALQTIHLLFGETSSEMDSVEANIYRLSYYHVYS